MIAYVESVTAAVLDKAMISLLSIANSKKNVAKHAAYKIILNMKMNDFSNLVQKVKNPDFFINHPYST